MESSQPKKVKLNDNGRTDCDDYRGFKVGANGDLEKEKITGISDRNFFSKYVAARKPVKITKPINGIPVEELLPDRMETTLKWESPLKVERKYKGGFGSNKQRCRMKLGELLELFRQKDGQYYMTTQYEDSSDEEVNEEKDEEKDEEDDNDCSDDGEGVDSGKVLDDKKIVQEPKGENADDSDLLLDFDLSNLRDDYDECVDVSAEKDYDEKRVRVLQLFQPPLTKFGEKLPLAPKPLSMLVPQQVNLWMGYNAVASNSRLSSHTEVLHDVDSKYVPGGTSSGLHHDHSDNLYVLISGKKRFTLFSPNYARRLYTVGNIYRVHQSGVIDYENDASSPHWQHVRDDGALVSQATYWKLSKEGKDGQSEEQESKSIDENENEQEATTNEKPAHPPSFSTIPPILLHLDEIEKDKRLHLEEFAEKRFPGFLDIPKLVVWLNPGESLYLPAGWFHEVSSFGSDAPNSPWYRNVHTALNYWFAPPNCNSYDKPYRDSYWKEDFELTKEALYFFKQKQLH